MVARLLDRAPFTPVGECGVLWPQLGSVRCRKSNGHDGLHVFEHAGLLNYWDGTFRNRRDPECGVMREARGVTVTADGRRGLWFAALAIGVRVRESWAQLDFFSPF